MAKNRHKYLFDLSIFLKYRLIIINNLPFLLFSSKSFIFYLIRMWAFIRFYYYYLSFNSIDK